MLRPKPAARSETALCRKVSRKGKHVTDSGALTKRILKYANKKKLEGPRLKEENPVYLIRKNVKIKRSSVILDNIKLGLFKIKEIKELIIMILNLLKDIKIYFIFYVSLLELVLKNVKIVII